jgi:hypothetical protein
MGVGPGLCIMLDTNFRESQNANFAKTEFSEVRIAPAQTAQDRRRGSHAPMGIMFLMYT